jgi:CubicO group peptidase (beta-lactamase class C family)
VDNTVFCMAGRHVTQTAGDGVYAHVHGAAPKREVWIIYRHSKDLYGKTTTAIVLEETSNRILLMDMDTDSPGDNTSRLLAGLQGALNSTREVRQVAATPAVRLVGRTDSLLDNGCYLFRPYALGLPKSGQAAPSILSATNLDRFIAERIRRDNLPGVTVAISDHGRLIFNKAYGYANVEKNEMMKPYHRACIGSTSKALATIGVEKLIQEGAIPGLSVWAYAPNRLGKPWFWAGVNEGISNGIHTAFGVSTTLTVLSNITIRHLLSHTAALGTQNDDVGAADAYAAGDYTNLTPQQQIRWFMATRQLLTNGVARLRRYSNPSFKQIGVLIEEVAGQPFETWMMNTVMIPAGVPHVRLMRTFEFEETWRDARRYHAYESGNPWATSRITQQFGPRPYGDAIYANAADGAAGSWTATAADLVRLMAALDRFPNKPDILDGARIDELDQRAFPAVSSSQGIGWDTCSPTSNWIQKNGNIGYGSSHLMRSMTNGLLTVAVVANSGANDATGNTAATGLCRAIFSAVQPLPPVSPNYDLFPAQLLAP